MNQIKKIVLTGGPCAGKTTAMVKVIEHFSSLGYKVFTIPEVPTMFTQAGMNYLTSNKDFFFEGEKATFQTQINLEDSFQRMAETLQQPVIIVCDRGTMDISTYLTPDFWNRIISEEGYTNSQLRNRYDAVLHLVSAADGAEQFYTTANNAQRLEQADEEGLKIARELDKKIVSAWKGHPHLKRLDLNLIAAKFHFAEVLLINRKMKLFLAQNLFCAQRVKGRCSLQGIGDRVPKVFLISVSSSWK